MANFPAPKASEMDGGQKCPPEKVHFIKDLVESGFVIHWLSPTDFIAVSGIGEWIDFGVFTFHLRDSKATMEEAEYRLLWRGSGPGGPGHSLRELRHTYFGNEEGYIFYIDIDMTIKALNKLKEWFA